MECVVGMRVCGAGGQQMEGFDEVNNKTYPPPFLFYIFRPGYLPGDHASQVPSSTG